MPALSRRKLAGYAAKRISEGRTSARIMREVGAYLIETGRQREAELVVRDIEQALIDQGIIIASVVSARPLTKSALGNIETFVKDHYPKADRVVLRERVDGSVIGGVRIELPNKQFDATVATKLDKITV